VQTVSEEQKGVEGERHHVPIGAEVLPHGGVRFRVWAPRRRRVEVDTGSGAPHPLDPEEGGYFSGVVEDAGPGTRYRYRLDEGEAYPDPASRFQPEGPHGPSEVVDPSRYRWRDATWKGIRLEGQVIYELHVGTFTSDGTWAAAAREIPELASAGITLIEVMPVAEFAGEFGWGYDGVNLFAPTRLYGRPDDFRRFVDEAHAAGAGVLLDVVYNHFGPDGNYWKEFSESYFTDRHRCEWGEAINFDGEGSGPVREFFIANAGYWIDEYHLDGLRLDATQSIHDASPGHILAAVTRAARSAAGGRTIVVVAENEPQDAGLARPVEKGGVGLDALWNDDFHHSAAVALTGRNEAYYGDFLGRPQELLSAVKWGFLYQGQRYSWQKKRRGTPALDLPPPAFVVFLENHDQVANAGDGSRLHQRSSPGRYRALTALLLLSPGTPMLFQGQEFASTRPFLYFADHRPDLAELVAKGRREFLSQFPSLASAGMAARLPLPHDRATFERCKLDLSERERNAGAYALHRDLLRLRREDPAFRAQRPRGVDGAILDDAAVALRFFDEGEGDRLLLVNMGRDLRLEPAPEPLLAPPPGFGWRVSWSSEDPRYGGLGVTEAETEEDGWKVPGEAALVLAPARKRPDGGDHA
jgi:maltooligosyltrehalose trehalohydrolase